MSGNPNYFLACSFFFNFSKSIPCFLHNSMTFFRLKKTGRFGWIVPTAKSNRTSLPKEKMKPFQEIDGAMTIGSNKEPNGLRIV
jgi:hypothetical protein